MCCLAAQVYEELEAGGAFDDGNISRSNLFLSVHDAVVFAQQSSAERRVSLEVNNFIIQILLQSFTQTYIIMLVKQT